MTPTPAWGEDWLRARARELQAHLRWDHDRLGRRARAVAGLLEAHYTAHRLDGSDPHPFFPGEPTPPPTLTRIVDALRAVGIVDPERGRRQLEDAFVRLNPDFGVLPESHDRRQPTWPGGVSRP